jgi:hypothetical protein
LQRVGAIAYVAVMEALDLPLTLLAIVGAAAVLLRAAGAAFRALRGGFAAFMARDLADVRAQRGDLTGFADAAAATGAARRRRMVALGAAAFWVGLLFVPPLTPWPRFLYAVYSLLWLVPRRPTTPHHV